MTETETGSTSAGMGWLVLVLGAINLVSFAVLGLHKRIELIWGFSIGTVDVLIGTGMMLAVAWVPYFLMDDPRHARIFMLTNWLVIGTIMLLASPAP